MVREWYWSRSASKEEKERPGCMRGMFHFFDFHHLLFTGGCRTPAATTSPPATEVQYQQQQQRYYASQCKGVEAPRNSLEFEESEAAIREDYYGVPISIEIAHPSAMARKKKELLTEEDKRKAQAMTPRTRSIVARLMGLEGLQDEVSSPCLTCYESTSVVSFSSPILVNNNESFKEKKKKKTTTKQQYSMQDSKKDSPSPRRPLRNLNSNISGSISLPDTPRASSERPRDTDPRHSLQHNKENSSSYTTQELSFLRELLPVSSTLRASKSRKKDYFSYQEENKNPRSQHFAREIVKQMKNSINKREGSIGFNDGDEWRKNKQTEKKYVRNNQLQPPTVLTCSSPKAGFSDCIKKVPQHPSPTSLPSTISLFKPKVKPDAKTLKMEPGRCRKTSNFERFTEKVKRQPPQLPVFSLQTEFPPPVKKEQEPLINHFGVEKEDPEFKYVKAILARADVVGEKSMKWFSPSLPIDPTIFHILELWFPFFEPVSREAKKVEEATARLGPLRHRWNRKLLFHLVEEILGDLLLSEPKRWRRRMDSNLLLSRLWSEIRSFPSADCRVVGDIDALVARDLPESKLRRLIRHPSVVAEVQDIASEIQRDILDSLLGDAAASLCLISSITEPKVRS